MLAPCSGRLAPPLPARRSPEGGSARAARREVMAAAGRLRARLWPWLWLWPALAAGAAALGKPSPVKVLSDGMWRELLQGEWMVEL